MVDGVDNVLAGCKEHIEKIKAETQRLYPGHTVIGMIAPTDVEPENAAAA